MNSSCVSDEDKLLAAHIGDLVLRCREKYCEGFSAFLDERQAHIAEAVLKKDGFDNYLLYGGYNEAARRILGVFPEYSEAEPLDFPMKALCFRYRKEDKLTHRDFLGAIMSCRVNRNMVGDILVNDGYAVVFVYETVAPALLLDITKIGSVGVRISAEENPEINIVQNFEDIEGTVPSMRADCIGSLALKISREKAAQIIKSGDFIVNYESVTTVSRELSVGDVFSVKGFGKYILDSINGKTKKDRLHICVKKYL